MAKGGGDEFELHFITLFSSGDLSSVKTFDNYRSKNGRNQGY
jgi:hypothetical protein